MNAALSLSLAAALGIPNAPYVRSRVDPSDPDSHCLWWKDGTVIEYRQGANGNPDTPGETELAAITRSAQTWQAVMDECGSLTLKEGSRTSSSKIGHDVGRADNENVMLFRTAFCTDKVGPSDQCWRLDDCMNRYDCWAYARGTIALTTTVFERSTGIIYGSDVELNAGSFVFTTVDAPPCVPPAFTQSCVATDVQNTMTHELGHLLGLDHTTYPGSTMNPSAPAGETSKRSLDPGTKQFVCDVYPKGRASRDCVINPMPAALGPAAGGCAAAPWSVAAPALLLGMLRRRRP
ncbi:MAG: matrixin family metalloprotease [Myxococcales bacterium]|nr:matrixin family metalloprotease [Myxococcales bacterium]